MDKLHIPAIKKAMRAEYASGVDITDDWNRMTPAQRQKAVADGLHVETDRSGRRVIGTQSQQSRTDALRNKVMRRAQENTMERQQ